MSEDKIIERIKKMLALANDLAASEGERDNALRMAFNTMAKYNIDMARVEAHNSKAQEPRIDFETASWSWLWAKQVNNEVARLFFCKYYYSGKINGTQCHHHFIGRESNAMTAAVMADYVVNSILKEGRKIGKQNTAPATRAFCIGALHSLSYRIDKLIAEKERELQGDKTAGTALVLASLYKSEGDANEAFLAEFVPDLRESKGKGGAVKDAAAYHAGADYGQKINLSTQVTGTPDVSPKLN